MVAGMARGAIFYLPTGGGAAAPGEAIASGDPGRPVIDGVEVVEVVGDGGGPARSGLAGALELLAASEATVLVVAQLRDAASSLGELVRLLAWLEEAGADLIAVDVGFDSGEAGARQAVALLREVERWDREPHPARRPRGRPGLSPVDPELAQRLAHLRERGLSLQAIADALNAERVPTPRAGRRMEALQRSGRAGLPTSPPAGSRRAAGASATPFRGADRAPARPGRSRTAPRPSSPPPPPPPRGRGAHP